MQKMTCRVATALGLFYLNSVFIGALLNHKTFWAAIVVRRLEHTPHDQEVKGSNPDVSWTFLLLFHSLPLSLSSVSLIRSLKEIMSHVKVIKLKLTRSCAAWAEPGGKSTEGWGHGEP